VKDVVLDEGGNTMQKENNQKMEVADSGQEHVDGAGMLSDKKVICPVCGNQIHDTNLVDAEGIVDDILYSYGGVLIVDSEVTLLCECEHRYDEDGFTIEEPHKLVAVVDAVFDESGKCTQFDITDIRPG
jgi:hypothetical protein